MTLHSRQLTRIANAKERVVDMAVQRLADQSRILDQEKERLDQVAYEQSTWMAETECMRLSFGSAEGLAAWYAYAGRLERQHRRQQEVVAACAEEKQIVRDEVMAAYQDHQRWTNLQSKSASREREDSLRRQQQWLDDAAASAYERARRA